MINITCCDNKFAYLCASLEPLMIHGNDQMRSFATKVVISSIFAHSSLYLVKYMLLCYYMKLHLFRGGLWKCTQSLWTNDTEWLCRSSFTSRKLLLPHKFSHTVAESFRMRMDEQVYNHMMMIIMTANHICIRVLIETHCRRWTTF